MHFLCFSRVDFDSHLVLLNINTKGPFGSKFRSLEWVSNCISIFGKCTIGNAILDSWVWTSYVGGISYPWLTISPHLEKQLMQCFFTNLPMLLFLNTTTFDP